MASVISVLPGDLRVPPSRFDGADPVKLHDQTRQYGGSTAGMPRPLVTLIGDDEHIVMSGVTRAARVHLHAPPGTMIEVEITEERRNPRAVRALRRIRDLHPRPRPTGARP